MIDGADGKDNIDADDGRDIDANGGGLGFAETGLFSGYRIITGGQVGDGVETVGAGDDGLSKAGVDVANGNGGAGDGGAGGIGDGAANGAAVLGEGQGGGEKYQGETEINLDLVTEVYNTFSPVYVTLKQETYRQ